MKTYLALILLPIFASVLLLSCLSLQAKNAPSSPEAQSTLISTALRTGTISLEWDSSWTKIYNIDEEDIPSFLLELVGELSSDPKLALHTLAFTAGDSLAARFYTFSTEDSLEEYASKIIGLVEASSLNILRGFARKEYSFQQGLEAQYTVRRESLPELFFTDFIFSTTEGELGRLSIWSHARNFGRSKPIITSLLNSLQFELREAEEEGLDQSSSID